MTAFTTARARTHRTTPRRSAWRHVNINLTALALAFVFVLAGVNIAAFLLGLPVIGLVFAVLGDALLVLAILRLRKTGNSVDDPLSSPAASGR